MMTLDDTMIKGFEAVVNPLLHSGAAFTAIEAAVASSLVNVTPAQRASLLAALQEALHPTHFINQRITHPDARFAGTYALLAYSFDEAERDPYDRFLTMLANLAFSANDHPIIMLDRYAQVPGKHRYDEDGVLRQFGYLPAATTELTVSLASGNYMSLMPANSLHESIGAIGHLVTRLHFRRGQGHGSNILHAFEETVAAEAQRRGEMVRLFALEAEPDSQGYWYKQGYRWVAGTNYAQPPLDFDPGTGAPLHPEVPETLMVKLVGAADITTVSTILIKDSVKTMYENWCIEKAAEFGPNVADVARNYVFGKVYRAFVESLPDTGTVALTAPPLITPA